MSLSVLFVVPSKKKFGDQIKDCGWYLPTVCFAYHAFVDAGMKVTFCSPFGGNSPVDPESAELWDYTTCSEFLSDRTVMCLLQNTLSIKEVNPEDYQVIYFAGGFASIYDFVNNQRLKEVTAEIYQSGGIVSSVGMGAAGLLNVRLPNGKQLIQKKKITGFTNVELDRSGKAHLMPYKLQTKLTQQGAIFQEGPPIQVNVVENGRIITGQNCTSTAATAAAVVKALSFERRTAPKKVNLKALFVLTNTGVLGDGKETGWFLPTVSYPYRALSDIDVSITFCSPYGGKAPADEESVGLWDHPENQDFMRNQAIQDQINNTVAAKDVDPFSYNIIYFAGGFGAVIDTSDNDYLNNIAAHIYENGGLVGAISNGVAGLLNVKLTGGRYLIEDQHVTGMTNEELSRLPECDSVPFKLETKLESQGALFQVGTPVKEKVVVSSCGRLLTGQNPNSSIELSHAFVKACKELKSATIG